MSNHGRPWWLSELGGVFRVTRGEVEKTAGLPFLNSVVCSDTGSVQSLYSDCEAQQSDQCKLRAIADSYVANRDCSLSNIPEPFLVIAGIEGTSASVSPVKPEVVQNRTSNDKQRSVSVNQVSPKDVSLYSSAGTEAWRYIQQNLEEFVGSAPSLVDSMMLYPNISAVPNNQPTTAPAFVSFTESTEATKISLVVDELNVLAGKDPIRANAYRVSLLTHEYCHILQRRALGEGLIELNDALKGRTWHNLDFIKKLLVEGGAEYTTTQILPKNLLRENSQYRSEGLAALVTEIVGTLPDWAATFYRAMYGGDRRALEQVIAAAAEIDKRLSGNGRN